MKITYQSYRSIFGNLKVVISEAATGGVLEKQVFLKIGLLKIAK